jgi:hypothetical protein
MRSRPIRHLPRLAAVATVVAALLLAATAYGTSRRSLWYRLPQDTLESFQFEATHSVATEFTRLPPEAEPFDVEALKERFAQVETHLSGRLERFVGRVFRDQSIGVIARMVDLAGTIDRGAGAEALDVSQLEGKSLSSRVVASGELLDSFGWSHFSGAGRGGDLVSEVLTGHVFRLPYKLPRKGESVGSTFQQRIPIDGVLLRSQQWVISYVRGTAGEGLCRRCVVLEYSGEVIEDSPDQHPARPMKLNAVGRVEGKLVLGPGGSARPIVSNEWTYTWDRTIRSERENGTVRGELKQTATVTGRIWRDGR